MEQFGKTQTWLPSTYSAKSLGEDTFHTFHIFDNRDNILRQAINLDRFGRFIQLHKESIKHFLSMNTIMRCPTSNKPLLTFGYAIITGITIHRESLPGKWAVA
jgi:hypothetical protein